MFGKGIYFAGDYDALLQIELTNFPYRLDKLFLKLNAKNIILITKSLAYFFFYFYHGGFDSLSSSANVQLMLSLN